MNLTEWIKKEDLSITEFAKEFVNVVKDNFGKHNYKCVVDIVNKQLANVVDNRTDLDDYVPENLIIKDGFHIIRVDVFNGIRKKPVCRITCIDDTSECVDLDGNWIDERTDGCFYTKPEHIDKIIAKLHEAKAFLNRNK